MIFLAVWLKVILFAQANSLAEHRERQLRKQLYFGYRQVILNKSLTRRKANITAVRQSHSSLDEYHKSVRIYLVAESLAGIRLAVFWFLGLVLVFITSATSAVAVGASYFNRVKTTVFAVDVVRASANVAFDISVTFFHIILLLAYSLQKEYCR